LNNLTIETRRNIMTATTNAKYTKVFLATMAAMGVTDEAQMEMFWKMEETKSNVSSALKAENDQKKEARKAQRTEGLKECAERLGLTVPDSAVGLDVSERGPKDGPVTGYLVKLVYGKRGDTRELRGTVSVGGEKKTKTEEQIEKEIDDLKLELFQNLHKILA
jgi:hypothetical protein